MHYNLLQFGNSCSGVSISEKYDWLSTVLNDYRPHLFTVNELNPNVTYANGIKALSFDYTDDVDNANFTNNTGSSIVNQLFYDSNIFEFTGNDVIGGSLRDINVYHLYVKETAEKGDTAYLDLIVCHLKAGNGSSDENQRQNSAVSIMNYINNQALGKNVLVLGDFNIYSNNEPAFQTFVFNSNQSIRLKDPAGKQNGWAGSGNAVHHTQSTRSNSPDCGSSGGMDDRFDMILASKEVMGDSAGIKYVPDTYRAFGNDGNSYNTELTCSGSGSVPLSVCIALKQLSDHLPVVMELEIAGATSIDKYPEIKGMKWYRVPSIDNETIEINLTIDQPKSESLSLEVWNITGQKLIQRQISHQSQTIQLPLQEQAKGFYFIRLLDNKGRQKILRL